MRRFVDLRTRARAPLAALAIVGILVAACSSSASLGTSGKGVNGGDGTGLVGAPNAPIAAASAAPMAAPAAGDASVGSAAAPGAQTAVVVPDGPQIVKTGSLSLQVSAIDSTLLKARAAIIGVGGYVSDQQRSNDGDQSTAVVTYRIPASRWDDALDALGGLAVKVLGEDTQSVEVTGQVIDLGARITNLQVTEQALQLIMDKATKISDILDVQNQLTAVEGQIEELNGQLSHLTDQAAMGTLAVTYTLPVVAVAEAANGWNFGAEVDRATAALIQVGQALAVVGLWLVIVGLPLLVGFLILAGLLVLVGRRTGLLRPRRLETSPMAGGTAGPA
jgi:hypothetical protein